MLKVQRAAGAKSPVKAVKMTKTGCAGRMYEIRGATARVLAELFGSELNQRAAGTATGLFGGRRCCRFSVACRPDHAKTVIPCIPDHKGF